MGLDKKRGENNIEQMDPSLTLTLGCFSFYVKMFHTASTPAVYYTFSSIKSNLALFLVKQNVNQLKIHTVYIVHFCHS